MNKQVLFSLHPSALILVFLLLATCQSPSPPILVMPIPHPPTPTFIPGPTLSDIEGPVLAGTPVPMSNEPITPENVSQIRELAMWGKGDITEVAYSPDGQLLEVHFKSFSTLLCQIK
jgi:hypothetical protein